jgi:predicted Zn-dependent protease with MMP-like domain
MKTWLRLPLAVRVVVIAAVWLGYAILVSDLDSLDPALQGAKFIWTACLVGSVVTVGVELGVRPKFGSIGQLTAYNRALQTGELPPGIELDVWRRWLRRSALTNFALWCAFPFVLFGWFSSMTSQSAYHWAPAMAFSLLFIWVLGLSWLRGVRIRRLAAELKRLEKAQAATTTKKAQAAVSREQTRPAQMTPEQAQLQTWFEGLVSDALDLIPAELAAVIDNVVVLVEDRHPDGRKVLGLYRGIPLTERDEWYAGSLPDTITIYRDALLAFCDTEQEVIHEVAVTVVHEIAHHFGIDDKRLHDLGWG